MDAGITAERLLANRAWFKYWLNKTPNGDDVVQTVAEKMLRSDVTANKSYTAKMLQTASIDVVRSEQTRKGYEDSYASQAAQITTLTPEHALEASQAMETLVAALSELSQLNQEIFIRACVDDQPRAAIAESLGLKLSTVEKRLAKAKQHCLKRVRPFLNQS